MISSLQQIFEAARQHHAAGRLGDAQRLYQQVLVQAPRHAESLHFLGVIAGQIGRHAAAADLFKRAIAVNPDYAEAHGNLANALVAMGLLDDAITACRRALALLPRDAQLLSTLGNVLRQKGELKEAIAACRQAIAIDPSDPSAHGNLGSALKDDGQLDAAMAAYRRVIALNPNIAIAHCELGNTLLRKGQHEQAIAASRRAIALDPALAEAHLDLGTALMAQGQVHEAAAAFRQAVAFRPDSFEAVNNLATSLHELGRLEQAVAAYRRAIALKHDLPDHHHNLSLALLTLGEFAEGWREYEWRWQCGDLAKTRLRFPQPQWDGSPLHDRSILLHAEQGLGDTIQFIRYASMVAQRGGRVIVACHPGLRRLAQTVDGIASVVDTASSLPHFDVHCPLMSLPGLLATNLHTIPAKVPYLHADPAQMQRWRERLSDHAPMLKVGLAWAGNPGHRKDRTRSMSPAQFAPLAQISGVRFFSLQKALPVADFPPGPVSPPVPASPSGPALIDFMPELTDLADTAALIANLDLVIAVDTSVAHLAGALGKPVWTLLSFTPDWRWLLHRDDSPWYPTMRLFRQRSIGDWDSVTRDVAEALRLLQGAATSATP